MSITSTSFHLSSLNEMATKLDIDFLDSNSKQVSKHSTVFTQKKSVETGETVDIYSQNGVSSDPVSNLFKNKEKGLFRQQDARGIQKAAEKWTAENPQGSSILVLDIQDLKKSYLDKSSIMQAETAFCNFCTQTTLPSGFLPRAQKVHAVFQTALPLDFVLCEGKLKGDLIKNFSDSEAEFLLTKGQGSASFCQVAEFYMTGFKFGQEAEGIAADEYFTALSSEKPEFKPQATNTIWYPESYKDLYSLEGSFNQVISPVFSVTGNFDSSSAITSVTLERK